MNTAWRLHHRSHVRLTCALALVLTASLASCSSGDKAPALSAITADGLMAHTKALSDDSLEGRAPATPGEEKTVAYLQRQFTAMGLEGGMPDGSFVQ